MNYLTTFLFLFMACCQSCSTLYWASGEPPGAIGWTDTEKKISKTIIKGTVDASGNCKTNPCFPRRLIYDPTHDRLIWSDLQQHALRAIDRKTGRMLEWKVEGNHIVETDAIPGDIQIDVDRNKVYFTLAHLTQPWTYSIHSVDLDDSSEIEELVPRQSSKIATINLISGGTVVASLGSPKKGPYSFWKFDLNTGDFFPMTDVIAETYEMEDSVVSRDGETVFWTVRSNVSGANGIWRASLDRSGKPVRLPVKSVSRAHEIDLRSHWLSGERLHWADHGHVWIASAKTDGLDFQVEANLKGVEGVGVVTGLEWVDRNPGSSLFSVFGGMRHMARDARASQAQK